MNLAVARGIYYDLRRIGLPPKPSAEEKKCLKSKRRKAWLKTWAKNNPAAYQSAKLRAQQREVERRRKPGYRLRKKEYQREWVKSRPSEWFEKKRAYEAAWRAANRPGSMSREQRAKQAAEKRVGELARKQQMQEARLNRHLLSWLRFKMKVKPFTSGKKWATVAMRKRDIAKRLPDYYLRSRIAERSTALSASDLRDPIIRDSLIRAKREVILVKRELRNLKG